MTKSQIFPLGINCEFLFLHLEETTAILTATGTTTLSTSSSTTTRIAKRLTFLTELSVEAFHADATAFLAMAVSGTVGNFTFVVT